MIRSAVFAAIVVERWRQQEKHGDAVAGNIDPLLKLAILTEEVGEVAKALLDGEPLENLRAELVQVAAVAVAWLESLPNPGPEYPAE